MGPAGAVDGANIRPLRRSRTGNEFRLPNTIAFTTFAFINILAAIYAPIQDCDEVFNYWEPTHYLNHGFGLQTWEYSPEYAIRSWLYVLIHSIPGKAASLLFSKRRYEFYFIRSLLAVVCAGAETRLFYSISRAYSFTIACIFTIAMVTAPGMFHASVAYLPSSFAMYTSMLGLAAFIDIWGGSKTKQGVTCFGIGAIVGWPFSAALIAPLFLDDLTYIWITGHLSEVADNVLGGVVRTLIIVVRNIILFLLSKIKLMHAAITSRHRSILLSQDSFRTLANGLL